MGYLPNPNSEFYALSGKTTGIVNNDASKTITMRNSSGRDWYGRKLRIIAVLNAVTSAALAGTPLADEPSPTIGSNTLMPRTLVSINIKVGSETLWTAAVSLDALL